MLKTSPLSAGRDDRSGLAAEQGDEGGAGGIFGFSQLCRGDVVFVAALVAVCALSVFIGVAGPLGSFTHDIFFLLDNAYRVVLGQVPDRDFSSAWGPVMYLIDATGLMLSGMRPAGLGYANALFGALLAIWAFLIVRSRGSSASACAVGIYTVLLIAAPFPIGNNPLDFGYAMLYNRYGYALFGIVMMECAAYALPARAEAPQGTGGAISTGIAVGLLAFLKISYAMVAIPFVAVLAICAGASIGDFRRRFLGLCGGFITVTVIVMCYLRFDVTDMVHDLATAATARRLSLEPLRPVGILDWVQGVIIFAFAGSLFRGESAAGRASRFRCILFALLTVGAGYLLFISNQQIETFPLNGYATIVLAAASCMAGKAIKWPGFSPSFPRMLLVGLCFLPFCIGNGISLASAALRWPGLQRTDVSLASPERGADLVFGTVRGSTKTGIMGVEYVEALNDGLALLRRDSGPREGVLTFDEFNPFNYLLDRPSPRGGFAATAYNYVFCDTAHPTAERFFGNASYVMVRKYTRAGQDSAEKGNVLGLMRIYGAALRSHFTAVEETDHWVLWHRVESFGEGTTR
jgi:hypothetical protein